MQESKDKVQVFGEFLDYVLKQNEVLAKSVYFRNITLEIYPANTDYVKLEITTSLTARIMLAKYDPLVKAVWNSRRFREVLSSARYSEYLKVKKVGETTHVYIDMRAYSREMVGTLISYVDNTMRTCMKELMDLLDRYPDIYDSLVTSEGLNK